jgi:hypothetical protein
MKKARMCEPVIGDLVFRTEGHPAQSTTPHPGHGCRIAGDADTKKPARGGPGECCDAI